jgi:hypothetical protein
MTPEAFVNAGIKLYGRKHWKSQLASALGINVVTVYRLSKLELPRQIPGPYEVALRGLLQHKRAQDILEREARKLLPAVRKKIKLRKTPRKPIRLRQEATARQEEKKDAATGIGDSSAVLDGDAVSGVEGEAGSACAEDAADGTSTSRGAA